MDKDSLEEIKNFLKSIPDKIVADDVYNYLSKTKNYLSGKAEKHLFSDIYEKRTSLYPNAMLHHMSTADKIALYGGGWGMGNYINVYYSAIEKKYLYYKTGDNNVYADFESANWEEFYVYVRKDLLDTYIWFNTPRNKT
jgi:hypothetical protein